MQAPHCDRPRFYLFFVADLVGEISRQSNQNGPDPNARPSARLPQPILLASALDRGGLHVEAAAAHGAHRAELFVISAMIFRRSAVPAGFALTAPTSAIKARFEFV